MKAVERAIVTITGTMPMLMHADNIEWSDIMEEWRANPDNRTASKAGDDRTPPWRWIGCLNYDDPKTGVVTIPSEYIMRSIMGGAAEVPTGKRQQTFKAKSQSGLLCSAFHWPLTVDGKQIPMAEVSKLLPPAKPSYKDQVEFVKPLGFTLFAKRAKIGASKHVRVRPRFDNWAAAGEIIILDPDITIQHLSQFLERAGLYKGLGDWRPGGKTPGPWGTFTATVKKA